MSYMTVGGVQISVRLKRVRCPTCGKKFYNETNVLQHLNQPNRFCSSGRRLEEQAGLFMAMQPPQPNGDPLTSSRPALEENAEADAMDVDMEEYGLGEASLDGLCAGDVPSLETWTGAGDEPLAGSRQGGPITDYFAGASHAYPGGKTFMDAFWEDEYATMRTENIFYPFASRNDWQFASWLVRSGLSMAAIDSLLSLEFIKNLPVSFRTAHQLRTRVELLPSGPRWLGKRINTDLPTKKPARLFYRDAIECLQALFSHLLFEPHLSFVPKRVWTCAARICRIYEDWLSGDRAWDLQAQMPTGSTCSVMAHPLLISLANIDPDIRSKTSLHAYLLLALLPIPKFIHKTTRMCSLAQDRLFHSCLDLVVKLLKTAATVGVMMNDPLETSAIALLKLHLSLSQPPRILPQRHCHSLWMDWPLAEPAYFITPEPLHHFFRFSWDHDTHWCIIAVGPVEIDFRFSLLQTADGISKLKQVTGRDHHSVQCAVPRDFVAAIPPRFTDDTLKAISDALQEFHLHKDAILRAGARMGKNGPINHWEIPNIHASGPVMQWSADPTEHAHTIVIKTPARSGNNQDYSLQISCYLDRSNKCTRFDLATYIDTLIVNSPDDDEEGSQDEHEPEVEKIVFESYSNPTRRVVDYFSLAEALTSGARPDAPRPYRTFATMTTAFHIGVKYSQCLTVDQAAEAYGLSDLCFVLSNFLLRVANNLPHNAPSRWSAGSVDPPPNKLQIWDKLRIQQRMFHDRTALDAPQTLRIIPPSTQHPHGIFDSVIISSDEQSSWPDGGLEGHDIIQVCLVFRLLHQDSFAAYVQRFNIVCHPSVSGGLDPGTRMHLVKRAMRSNGERIGYIIPLTMIKSPIHLIPRFGKEAHSRLTQHNSYELSEEFWVNKYWNKEIFYALNIPLSN
ncbi:hypothetical protein BU15DRAFT_89705 [Melanogaster broomeanus]|nr:hypothetical protein BU15DRAFT_89705 [Melanogaster broomeanus]